MSVYSPAKAQAEILMLDKLLFMKIVVSTRKPQRTMGFFWACKNKCHMAVEGEMRTGCSQRAFPSEESVLAHGRLG